MAARNLVKAVGYARRSTDMQERSIPDQQAFVERWAAEHGYTILRWFTDDAVSGTSTKGREAFERMIHDAENGRGFDAVLVYDISRFSRGGSTEIGFFLYRLQQAGVRVVFCAEALPEDDGGELLLGVKSWQAHQYCVKLSRDCIRGAVSSIKVKRSAPGGRAPYGYDRQYLAPDGQVLRSIRHLPDGRKQEFDAQGRHVRFIPGPEGIGKVRSDIVRYVPGDPAHVKTVRRIFDLCARGYGFRCIAIALNDDGVASPTGGRWNHRQVKLILANPAYRGALCYNKTTQGKIHGIAADGRPCAKKGKAAERNSRDRWIVVEGVHEPLVTKQVFEKAQAETARRHDKGGLHRPTQRYLLSGLLRCTHCGLNFWGAVLKLYHKGIDRRYYVDAGYRRYGRKVCKSTSIQAEALDCWVLGKVRELLQADAEGTQAAVDAFVRQVMARQKRGTDTSAVERELAAVNKRIKATVAMLAEPDLEDMDELKTALVDLKRQRETLEARKADSSNEKGRRLNEASLRKWAREKLERLGEAADGKVPPLETRRLVHAYVDRIEVDPHKCTGVMYIPADAGAFLAAEHIRRVNFGSPQFTPAIRGFHAQQAVEKALKGWLACAGVCFPMTHDLRALFDLLDTNALAVPEALRRLERLSVYAVLFRYDALGGPPDDVDFAPVCQEIDSLIAHIECATEPSQ
ncbi:MAG: hypothetical protein AMS14_00590 [Planctomycetes bacterium DG_20]|nr:MAG: hypothetical protein AMS14_00590 [Planctomycetes bacterium DG_20]